MSIVVTWSLTSGGVALDQPVDLGSFSPLETGDAVTIFLRHNGTNPLLDTKLFIGPYSGDYEGSFDPAEDLTFMKEATQIGQLWINTNWAAGFPNGSWQAVSQGGSGDDLSDPIDLGDIPIGDNPGVSFKLQYRTVNYDSVSQEDLGFLNAVGVHQLDMKLAFVESS